MPVVDERKRGFSLGDYVEVKDRIRLFLERYPDGRLVTADVRWPAPDDDAPRIAVKALAYRSADDPHPAVGWSWMVLPGSTTYTRGSELENTETSAWGRAIGALGIGIDKSIASANEVQAKQHDEPQPAADTGGLIGTVEEGKRAPVDLQLRETADGPAFGFSLVEGRTKLQVLALGALATPLSMMADSLRGARVQVWGQMTYVEWKKDGKDMPPYRRLLLERIVAPEFTLPADEPEEAETATLFSDEESAAIDEALAV